jgi:hypothetical protein
MLRKTYLAVVSSFFLMLPGCGGGNSTRESNPGGRSTYVEVTPATPNVYEGETIQFQAKVLGQSDQAVTWSLQALAIGMIDDTGLYTAPGDASGEDIVIATSHAVPSAGGSAKVTVLAHQHQVTISPATATLSPGGTQTFTATVDGVAGANVTWSIQELRGGSISGGTYEAPLKTGFYHVIATSVADSSANTSATISVTTSTGRFTPTGSMQNGRGRAATLLNDGTVLVAGGDAHFSRFCDGGIASAELYDPVAGSFTITGSMLNPRVGHAAVLLPDGEVLITGGLGSAPPRDCEDDGPFAQSSAELYDPSTHGFKLTQSMAEPRVSHTATLLGTGKVLIVGDSNDTGVGSTSELYDPESRRFTLTGSMSVARYCHTATLMPNGKVLIAGGGSPPMATAEVYDPTTGAFTLTGSMLTARCNHTATMLQNGLVLITGGATNVGPSASAELYNPITGSFSVTGSMVEVRDSHTATLLPNGMVLVAGGDSTAELFDPATGSFSPTGAMEVERSGHSATLLKNGAVLVAGGASSRTAELYK